MIYLDYKMDFEGTEKKWYKTNILTEYQIEDKHSYIVDAFLNNEPIYFKTIEGEWSEYTTFPQGYGNMLDLKTKNELFTKDDSKKTNLAILGDISLALEQVAKVMQYGANKYSRKNWDKVDDKERYIAATYRHLMQGYQQGEVLDKESGLPHLAHAICSLLFLSELDERGSK